MITSFEAILSSLCSRVEQLSETEFQQIFALNDAKEAKLAYDILLTSGFEVKLYNEAEASKMYVTRPNFDAATLATKMDTAQALATNFKAVKLTLDELNKNNATGIADYAITLVNGPNNHKQLAIALLPVATQHSATAPAAPSAAPTATRPAASPQKPAAKPVAKKKAEAGEEMLAGPQISREYNYASKATRGVEDSKNVKNFMSRMFVQHIGSNGTLILGTVFGVLLIVSLIIASRSFLCPDFALQNSKQNHSVFCKKAEESDEDDKDKLPQ